MIYAKIQEILSLLLSVQYTHNKNREYNYSRQPRSCHNFVFMLEGKCTIQFDDQTIELEAGNILFTPKNITYKSKQYATPKAVFHSLHFSFHPKNDMLTNHNIPIQLLDNTDFEFLYSLLNDIELYQFSKAHKSFLALSSFYWVCGKLFSTIKINETKPINKTLSPTVTYIHKQLSIKEIAQKHGFVSPIYFERLLKKIIGNAPSQYRKEESFI